jgi:hypothetical protein
MSQHKLNLLVRYAREPFKKLINASAAFKIFE